MIGISAGIRIFPAMLPIDLRANFSDELSEDR